MIRLTVSLLCLSVISMIFTSCATVSEDSAPGGIRSNEVGMDVQGVRDWQDRTIRQLAY